MPYISQAASYAAPAREVHALMGQRISISPDKKTLKISGKIDKKMLMLLRRFDLSNVKRLEINSLGGDPSVALRIGRVIAERDITVFISGVCASACASDIAVLSKRLIVAKGGVLLFHNTATSIAKISEKGSDISARRYFLGISHDEMHAYSKFGIDSKLLTFPQVAIGTICYRYIIVNGKWMDTQYKSYLVASYIPDGILKKFGVRIASNNKLSSTEVSQWIYKNGISIPPSSLSIIGNNNFSLVYNQHLQELPAC